MSLAINEGRPHFEINMQSMCAAEERESVRDSAVARKYNMQQSQLGHLEFTIVPLKPLKTLNNLILNY
jgi:hypothetical protein